MATGVAGGMLAEGARQLAQGKRPKISDLLLTPANAVRVTRQLAQLRGAAMKVGQLISMDAGDMLPPELAQILARLRSDAQPMPKKQLMSVLDVSWGPGWQAKFKTFSFAPLAAASIGQVHRAQRVDAHKKVHELAIKIQYPGVRESINSDVDNVASLLRMTGLLPRTLDLAPLLRQAKTQLHDEADYLREGSYLQRYATLLADSPEFLVPELYADLTTHSVLAMSYVSGVAVEAMVDAPQDERNRIISLLMGLLFRELFEFQLIQTDSNFANYRYNTDTHQLVLLDFGATRPLKTTMVKGFRRLMKAAAAGDSETMRKAALGLGYFADDTQEKHQRAVLELFDIALEPLRFDGDYDFANSTMPAQLRDAGIALGLDRDFWHIPPIDTLLLHRKLGGLFLLAARLRAQVNVRVLMQNHLRG